MPSWKYPKEQERPKFAQLVIPTLDSVRYEKLLTLAYSVQKVCTHTLLLLLSMSVHCSVETAKDSCYKGIHSHSMQ